LPPRLSWDDVRRAIDAIGMATPIELAIELFCC
jgi:integrase/recombinase XerD